MQPPSLGQKDPLEKEMAACTSILAWEIPRAAEPGRSWGLKRVRHNISIKQQQG